MNDRGMLKWAPCKSLDQQADYLARMEYERNKTQCPIMSSEKAEEINAILTNYKGETLIAKYWHDGYIYTIHGKLKEISVTYRYLMIEDIEIRFNFLTELTFEN